MNYRERSWLAGFTDGEGCIGIFRKKEKRKDKIYEYFIPRVILANTDKKVMRHIQHYFKDSCSFYEQKREANWKKCYIIKFIGHNAIKIIKVIYPYLKIKKEQALLCMKLQKTINPKRNKLLSNKSKKYRKSLYDKCKILNKRGINI